MEGDTRPIWKIYVNGVRICFILATLYLRLLSDARPVVRVCRGIVFLSDGKKELLSILLVL